MGLPDSKETDYTEKMWVDKVITNTAGQNAELIDRSGKAVFHTYLYENKIEELGNLITNLEDKVQLLTKQKVDAEQCASSFKVCLYLSNSSGVKCIILYFRILKIPTF